MRAGGRGRDLVARCAMAATAALLAAPPAAAAQTPTGLPPAPRTYLTDRAGAVPAALQGEIEERLEAFEQETTDQLVVWVDRRIPEGFDLNSFANEAFSAWGVGQEERDNGVLFVVFTEERKARIEVGYGLEGALPDALAGRILEEQAIPRFREGDYAEGIEAGVAGIIQATKGEYRGRSLRVRDPAEDATPAWILTLLGLVLGLGFFAVRWFGGWGPGFWIGSGGWSRGDGGFGGGGFGGGGGFSGGGGSSGGGGASGSW